MVGVGLVGVGLLGLLLVVVGMALLAPHPVKANKDSAITIAGSRGTRLGKMSVLRVLDGIDRRVIASSVGRPSSKAFA